MPNPYSRKRGCRRRAGMNFREVQGRTMQDNREIERTTREQSRFISAARFLMICGLAYHHLFEIPGSANSPRFNLANNVHFIPEFINAFFHMAFMAAVPVLSVITGYLFFRGGGRVDFRAKLQKRFF